MKKFFLTKLFGKRSLDKLLSDIKDYLIEKNTRKIIGNKEEIDEIRRKLKPLSVNEVGLAYNRRKS